MFISNQSDNLYKLQYNRSIVKHIVMKLKNNFLKKKYLS